MGQASQTTSINSDVKEVVETTSYIVQSLIDLWALLPNELKVFIVLLAATSLLMEFTKKTVISGVKPKKKRVAWLWFAGMLIGNAAAYTGNRLLGDYVEPWYWIFLALCISTCAMAIHWISIKVLAPIGVVVYNEVMDRAWLFFAKKPRPKAPE